MMESIAAIALWCGQPTVLNRTVIGIDWVIKIEEVQACRRKIIACIESSPVGKKCFTANSSSKVGE